MVLDLHLATSSNFLSVRNSETQKIPSGAPTSRAKNPLSLQQTVNRYSQFSAADVSALVLAGADLFPSFAFQHWCVSGFFLLFFFLPFPSVMGVSASLASLPCVSHHCLPARCVSASIGFCPLSFLLCFPALVAVLACLGLCLPSCVFRLF